MMNWQLPSLNIPTSITNKPIAVYLMVLIVIAFLYSNYSMQWFGFLWGAISVCGFFFFISYLSKICWRWSPKLFHRNIFVIALVIRWIYVLLSYWFYWKMTGTEFEFHSGDSLFYDDGAKLGATLLRENFLTFFVKIHHVLGCEFSDVGYPAYLSFSYWLTNDSVLLSRLIKCVVDAGTVVILYKYASRSFGEIVGRTAAIMCLLCPSLIFYCGLTLKETEMVFLCVLFVERADNLLRGEKFVIGPTLFVVLIALALFTFRTVLGAVALLSLLASVVFSNSRVAKKWKRILVGLVAFGFVVLMMGNQMKEDLDAIIHTDVRERQRVALEWRSVRNDDQGTANSFAKYASASVFAPLIFTIPFPTMINLSLQENQQLQNGAYFVKNVLSFFVILALLLLLLSGEWRRHVLPLAFVCGYLFILVFSNFAQAGRFHMPVMPFELVFASYGIYAVLTKKKYKRWYSVWLFFMFFACIGWNWFKLKGRGLY